MRLISSAFFAVAFRVAPGVRGKADATRQFPDSSNGVLVFSDQLDTSSSTEAQVKFAATHYVGTQKLLPALPAICERITRTFSFFITGLVKACGTEHR